MCNNIIVVCILLSNYNNNTVLLIKKNTLATLLLKKFGINKISKYLVQFKKIFFFLDHHQLFTRIGTIRMAWINTCSVV